MKISVNGEIRELQHSVTLSELVEILELGERRIAIEVNEELVPRSVFPDHDLHDGDRVEIVHAIGGG
jgi:sulfur carrier protein